MLPSTLGVPQAPREAVPLETFLRHTVTAVYTLDADHSPFFSADVRLCEVLEEIAAL